MFYIYINTFITTYYLILFLKYIVYSSVSKMSNSLHIMSYNCYGLSSILVDLYNLCERFFNIFLYETILLIHKLSILTYVHPDLIAYPERKEY